MEHTPCKKFKSEWHWLLLEQVLAEGRVRGFSRDERFAAGGPLCALGSVSASPMVEMETGGITAEAGGGEGSPSLWCWS